MADESLLQLVDGAILKIKDSAWIEYIGYCDTCAGATLAKDLAIETTQGTWLFNFGDGGDDSVTVEFIMGTILPNLTEIQSMTILSFIDWFTNHMRSQARSNRETFKVTWQ